MQKSRDATTRRAATASWSTPRWRAKCTGCERLADRFRDGSAWDVDLASIDDGHHAVGYAARFARLLRCPRCAVTGRLARQAVRHRRRSQDLQRLSPYRSPRVRDRAPIANLASWLRHLRLLSGWSTRSNRASSNRCRHVGDGKAYARAADGEASPGQLLRLFRFVVDRDTAVDGRAFDAGDRDRHAVGVIAGHELAPQLGAYDTLQVLRAGHRIRRTPHLFGELIAHRAGDRLLVDGHGLGDRRGTPGEADHQRRERQ